MTTRLITAPSVILIAQPQLIVGSIDQFAAEQGLSVIADNPATPLGRISAQSCDTSKADDIHNDGEALIEFAGRQCYHAWEKGRSPEAYIENILQMGHGSVLAHAQWSFMLTGISRSLTLELNRHGTGTAISQESQRYVDASTVKFVVPPALLHLWGGTTDCQDAFDFLNDNEQQIDAYNRWQEEVNSMVGDYDLYPLDPWLARVTDYTTAEDRESKAKKKRETMLRKRANETARAVLPNDCETKMVWSANARALRYIISLRGAEDADLEIRRFAAQLAIQCKVAAPTIFKDVEIGAGDFGVPVTTTVYHKV